jgi:hypothetical protein
MKNDSNHVEWMKHFKIDYHWNVPWRNHHFSSSYALIELRTGLVVGRYGDYKYACKQARRRCCRMLAKIERTLLG